MKPAKPTPKPRPHAFWVPLLLAVLLGLLFGKSFNPSYVFFSNDSPLGVQMAAWLKAPQCITGMWDDLNIVGFNAGALSPSITALIHWVSGPVGFAKFYAPIALFILGIGAWTFFRQLKLAPLASTLGALAAALTSTFFSDACWGTASHQIAFGMDFFALALIVSNSPTTPWFLRWTRLALAGMAVGMNVMEAADIGAIFSVLVAAFTLFHSFTEDGPGPAITKFARGVGRIAVIAIFAAFLAAQTIISLVGTQIEGIVGVQQNTEAKAQQWNWATQWSFPKIETLGFAVPGLFGYRMDTTDGGNYWGATGRDPAWDRYFAGDQQGPPPQGFLRFSGTGNYAGVLVILAAFWTIAQSLRRQNSVFSTIHRRFIWFWTVVLIVSLLLAFGRFSPFAPVYQFIYSLPYLHLSTVRNPIKFLFVFSWAIVIIFGCGIHGLSRRYLETPTTGSISFLTRFKTWWAKARDFDRTWTSICVVFLIGSLPAWLVYALQKPRLVAHLKTVGFPDENAAGQIAAFSVSQVGWFILFFALALGLLTLILSGAFAGRRAKWGGILLGTLLVLDLGRADLPWLVFWNYPQKYAGNPIISLLQDKPYEHRVAVLHSKSLFEELYSIEWSQQLFLYYNIQSLDVIQMSREPENLAAYRVALSPQGTPDTAYLVGRHWELTNTRYLLGPAAYLDALNQQLDPSQHRFRIVQRFGVVPKPGIENPTQYSELTAVPAENGDFALIEFTGALPRVKLYSQWQVSTNDSVTLQTLASANFDAWETVLVSTNLPMPPAANTTNANPGTVEFKSYSPTDILFDAHADEASVLLLNDEYDPNWRVFVDDKPAPLLRCNFLMRGVYLAPGIHVVEFKFKPAILPLWVSLAALLSAVGLTMTMYWNQRRFKRDFPSNKTGFNSKH
jgi:hypothetical protein